MDLLPWIDVFSEQRRAGDRAPEVSHATTTNAAAPETFLDELELGGTNMIEKSELEALLQFFNIC